MATETDKRRTVLIVDDDPHVRWVVAKILASQGYHAAEASTGSDAIARSEQLVPDCILLDLHLPDVNGLEVLQRIRQKGIPSAVIILTGHGDIRSAIKAIKNGADDMVMKPFENDGLLLAIESACEHGRMMHELALWRERLARTPSLRELMGPSLQSGRVIEEVERVARTGFTVLLEGETGTGKELVARAIHDRSDRRGGPFVGVDAGAVPETLIESELFGHEAGAFTGAHRAKPGYFELADKGTLFLDEVANLPISTQAKLLRVLEERVVRRLGAKDPLAVDCRILCASNRPLEEEIKNGSFRKDLFYRLAEYRIEILPLRDRRDDISHLARRFAVEASEDLKRDKPPSFSRAAMQALIGYPWTGNIRELRNVVRRAVLAHLEQIEVQDLFPEGPGEARASAIIPLPEVALDGPLARVVQQVLEQIEQVAICRTLKACNGSRKAAAERLGIDRATLHRKIKRYAISAAPEQAESVTEEPSEVPARGFGVAQAVGHPRWSATDREPRRGRQSRGSGTRVDTSSPT